MKEAYKEMMKKLMTAPVLGHPDMSQRFYLHTDASEGGLGAVLTQMDKKTKKHYAVAYASRESEEEEINYGITHLEFLGVIWAIKKFRQYLALTVARNNRRTFNNLGMETGREAHRA